MLSDLGRTLNSETRSDIDVPLSMKENSRIISYPPNNLFPHYELLLPSVTHAYPPILIYSL